MNQKPPDTLTVFQTTSWGRDFEMLSVLHFSFFMFEQRRCKHVFSKYWSIKKIKLYELKTFAWPDRSKFLWHCADAEIRNSVTWWDNLRGNKRGGRWTILILKCHMTHFLKLVYGSSNMTGSYSSILQGSFGLTTNVHTRLSQLAPAWSFLRGEGLWTFVYSC